MNMYQAFIIIINMANARDCISVTNLHKILKQVFADIQKF